MKLIWSPTGPHINVCRSSGTHVVTYCVLRCCDLDYAKTWTFQPIKASVILSALLVHRASLSTTLYTDLTYPICQQSTAMSLCLISTAMWRQSEGSSFVLALHLIFPYNAFLLHQTILTQDTQFTIKHHTPAHGHMTTFTVKLNTTATHTRHTRKEKASNYADFRCLQSE